MPIFDFSRKDKKLPNLKGVLSQLETLRKEIKQASQEIERLKKENRFSVKKIGMLRFNPFQERGGNQSFSIALLDDNDDGVVITGLYDGKGSRVFAKPIKKGESEYSLSKEEREVLKKAKKEKFFKEGGEENAKEK